ncbi:LmeA family phospholipid-binding protein [Mycobacterium sp.]|uniref:LmeA family phospholipid-binding protein n=1 Tax=Mycobacterium sp. TaxID=1785 RepID=UPI0025FC763F|nr:LmeA family phospholipid-binding protein [Mycobacterium sp.]MBW0014209.1 hypothetical protein [Mycobacterium sp.]
MSPKVPRLRWDDPFRALDTIASLWSSSGLPSVGSGAVQAVALPYRTLFTTLQQLLVGKKVTVHAGDHQVVLTVTEFDSALDPRELAVGQLGQVRIGARDITWDQHHLQHAVAVLHNVHFRPGVPPTVTAAPAELTVTLPGKIVDDALRRAAPQLRSVLGADGAALLHWSRRPGWGGLEVGVDVVGTTLWLRPSALLTGQRRWALPARIPAYPVPLPDLPHGLLVTDVRLESDALEVSGLLPQWRMELPLRSLEEIITRLSRGVFSLVLP